MRTLGLIRRATPEPARDTWLRLQARLREEDEMVQLALPALGWREAAAFAAALAAVVLVPDPLGFLIASGVL